MAGDREGVSYGRGNRLGVTNISLVTFDPFATLSTITNLTFEYCFAAASSAV